MNWDTINRRLARAADRLPTPATDPVFDPDVFTDLEVETMEAVARRHPTLRRGGDLSLLSDDDLADLTAIAERLERRRDGGEEATP